MLEFPQKYIEYLDTFKKLGVRPFSEEDILRKKLGDFVSINISRDILFSMMLLSPKKYVPYIYSWGKFLGLEGVKQSMDVLKLKLFTRLLRTFNPMYLLNMDIYRNEFVKSWIAIKSAIPSITYVDETAETFRVKSEECDNAYGIPKIGKKICFFEGSLMAGNFEGVMNTPVNAVEVKCIANGDPYCEFLCSVNSEFPKLEIFDKIYFKKIKNFILKDFLTKRIIRPTLGNFDHIATLQTMYLGLWLSSTGSHTLLYWIGKNSGLEIGKKVKGKTRRIKMKNLVDIFEELKIGIVKEIELEEKLLFTVKECAFCVGAKNFEKRICSYLAGFFAGFLETSSRKRINVIETKCIANGDPHCEFLAVES